jgi:hypothetical protein
MMRLIIDTLVALMLAGVLAGVVTFYNGRRDRDGQVELARAEVERFQREIMLQAALEQVPQSEAGYPRTIDLAWFQGDLPLNPLLDEGRPWLEIASAADRHLAHPVYRCASQPSLASFWYNPANGIVRARVPAGISDHEALGLYNRVNACSLESLFAHGSDEPAIERVLTSAIGSLR